MSLLYKPEYQRSVAVEPRPRRRPPLGTDRAQLGLGLVVGALLAALTTYLGFNAGGFFAGTTAVVTIALCLLSAIGVLFLPRPLESLTPALLVPLALLTGFAAWTLASATWSGGSARALLEFDRTLLYVVALFFFGAVAGGRGRLDWGIKGLVVAAVAICAAGWMTRVAADVWPIAIDVRPERLSFPLTYWNALGLLASLGLVACAYLSSSRREARLTRIVAAAATPLLASTLLLTYSRASLALVPLGLLVYALIARPRRLVSTALATALPVAVAIGASYRAEEISSATFASSTGVAEGHELAVIVIVCMLVAGGLRALLTLRVDRRLDAWEPPSFEPRRALAAAAAAAVVLVVALTALGGPSWVSDRYHGFVEGDEVGHHDDPRGRLTSSGNNGRIAQWEVALDAFRESPVRGEGAGTYQLQWAQDRPYRFTVIDAHSLYLEVLGELGVVGLLLVGGALVAIGVGLARRARGEQRGAYALVLALAAIWAVHAGVDWDWEMPVITLWLFALAGLGLSRPREEWDESAAASYEPSRIVRILAALALAALAIVPAAIAVSQSRLDSAVAEFGRGDCDAAIGSARGSLDALTLRAEPHEVIGYCGLRLGEGALALEAMEKAVDRDPGNWETHYGLALVRAFYGTDPMPELYESRRLNPREPSVLEAIRGMRGQDPQEWERLARSASLPF
jgi:O-antigen ligase